MIGNYDPLRNYARATSPQNRCKAVETLLAEYDVMMDEVMSQNIQELWD